MTNPQQWAAGDLITTINDEASLPDDTILLGANGAAYQSRDIYTWSTGGDDSWYCDVPLPARILWLPSDGLPQTATPTPTPTPPDSA